MSKRRITQQQRRRVDKSQVAYQDTESHENGLVIGCYGRFAIVEAEEGRRIHCAVRPNLDTLVAGDKIVWRKEGKGQGVILSRYQRETVLSRSDKSAGSKPIAANLSQIVIVVAVIPLLSWSLLDSYLVMAECLNIAPLIVLNKTDLDSEPLKKELLAIYTPLGYRVVFTNQTDTADLRRELENQVSVFVGQSGVGKSSLIRKVLPTPQEILTSALSDKTQLGRHTTSNSKYYHLSHKGALIDSPGIREFSLAQLPMADVIYGFPEFRALASQCKFRNCNHQDNLGCAIHALVKENPQFKKRYQSLLEIM